MLDMLCNEICCFLSTMCTECKRCCSGPLKLSLRGLKPKDENRATGYSFLVWLPHYKVGRTLAHASQATVVTQCDYSHVKLARAWNVLNDTEITSVHIFL
jgi:hypothetical protein